MKRATVGSLGGSDLSPHALTGPDRGVAGAAAPLLIGTEPARPARRDPPAAPRPSGHRPSAQSMAMFVAREWTRLSPW